MSAATAHGPLCTEGPVLRTLRRLGSLLLISGAVLLGAATLAPPVSATAPVYNATLKVEHIGSTNPGFGTGSCPAAGWGWHFLLQGNSTTFIAIKATFQSAGDITTFISSPTAKHAYVFTPGPDTLLGAVAEVSGPDLDFNLSHVCTGPAVTTTVPEVTTTVPEGSTTVPEVTTTVPEGSTTVPEVTTTLPEVTTTLPEVTTTVPEVTTTLPEVTTTLPEEIGRAHV